VKNRKPVNRFYDMEFDIAIATRNRLPALRLSLPLMLAQNRIPRALIVVDGGDDFEKTERVVREAAEKSGVHTHVVVTASQAGTSHQRNVALKHVESPIVFFPDDDALWFPGFADSIMRIYERDTEERIGAVGGTESAIPPPGILPGARAATDGLNVRLPGIFGNLLDLFERKFFPDPFFTQAGLLAAGRRPPAWLIGEGARLAPTITGFRMSFRTDLIANVGFDEALGRYALFEDHDACMSVLEHRLIVNADRARVFHYRDLEARTGGLELGVMHILNRAYILSKHPSGGLRVRTAFTRYAYYKLLRYLLRTYSGAMRKRFVGAWRAAGRTPLLWEVCHEDLADHYVRLREECLNNELSGSTTTRDT
jgi:glycosyltransferase involved in cell wall biosynthesis